MWHEPRGFPAHLPLDLARPTDDQFVRRVPLIANWPGATPAGKVLNDLVDFSDFFTTFADLGGAKLQESVKLDGHSFAPQLRGEKGSPRDWIFVQLGAKWYVRDQGFKLTESGELFDMADAPFVEKPATNDAEKAKLQAILTQLDPAGGKATGAGKAKKSNDRKTGGVTAPSDL